MEMEMEMEIEIEIEMKIGSLLGALKSSVLRGFAGKLSTRKSKMKDRCVACAHIIYL